MKLIFGCGYLGQRIAQQWLAAGTEVSAVTRSETTAAAWRALGIRPIVADVTDPTSLSQLPPAETVLYAIGFDRAAGRSMRTVYVEGLQHVLAALQLTGKFIYVSSTGVYGDFQGDWIDETAPCRPDRDGGRVCLAAEQLLQTSRFTSRAIVLRMAGIYGPGRIPRRKELIAGDPIPAPEQGWLNLIHVDDAAAIVLAAAERAAPPTLWHVSDGQPVQRGEYFRELARLLQAPEPRFVPPAAGSPVSERAASDKRINNSRLVRELGVTFMYPSYRAGLQAILAAENQA